MSFGNRKSFRARLRRYFAIAVLTAFAVAAVTTLVLVRRANEQATITETAATARAGAETVRVQITAFIDPGGQPATAPILTFIDLLESALALQNSEVVRVSELGVSTVKPNSELLEEKTPIAGVPVSILEPSSVDDGEGFTTIQDRRVVAVEPVLFTAAEAESLQLGEDLIVVVATQELGPAGLGSAGTALLGAGAASLIAAALISELLASRVRKPLTAVVEASGSISSGELTARVELPPSVDSEVAELAIAINEMADRLEHARDERQQFLIDVSHELRTPLTSVIGYAELLEEGELNSAEGVKKAGVVIGREATRIQHLVEDLITLTRLDSSELQIQSTLFDLDRVCNEVVAALGPRATAKGTELTVRGDAVEVVGDPFRTQQIVSNLVTNALDFAASTVAVQIRTDDRWGVVTVTDDGPGIGVDRDRVFERRGISEGPRDRHGNLGIGLSIVAGLAAAMGGTVDCEDPAREPDPEEASQGGTRFVLRLPQAAIPR
jgi:signal transduction histidine kinase